MICKTPFLFFNEVRFIIPRTWYLFHATFQDQLCTIMDIHFQTFNSSSREQNDTIWWNRRTIRNDEKAHRMTNPFPEGPGILKPSRRRPKDSRSDWERFRESAKSFCSSPAWMSISELPTKSVDTDDSFSQANAAWSSCEYPSASWNEIPAEKHDSGITRRNKISVNDVRIVYRAAIDWYFERQQVQASTHFRPRCSSKSCPCICKQCSDLVSLFIFYTAFVRNYIYVLPMQIT